MTVEKSLLLSVLFYFGFYFLVSVLNMVSIKASDLFLYVMANQAIWNRMRIVLMYKYVFKMCVRFFFFSPLLLADCLILWVACGCTIWSQCGLLREWMAIVRYDVHCYSHEVNSWFTKAIGRPCTLWRSSATNRPWKRRGGASMCRDTESPLNFVNEAQFLLISEASVSDLNDRLRASMYVNHSYVILLQFAVCYFSC